MLNDIYIIGAGGFGREVAWLIERINNVDKKWCIKGFLDDDESSWNKEINGYRIVGGIDSLRNYKDAYVVCAIGSAETRKKVVEKIRKFHTKFATLIDPSVIISSRISIGEGTIICAGTIITVDVAIGNHVIINLDCTLGHDDVIGNYVTVYPSANISGTCIIGECTEIGTGAQIIQGITVGDGIILGAGTVVVKNIVEKGTYVGCPARSITYGNAD